MTQTYSLVLNFNLDQEITIERKVGDVMRLCSDEQSFNAAVQKDGSLLNMKTEGMTYRFEFNRRKRLVVSLERYSFNCEI